MYKGILMDKPDIRVESYPGHKGEETPSALAVDGDRTTVTAVIDRWDSDTHSYFRVSASDGRRYVLRYHYNEGLWELVMQERTARK